MKDLTGDRNSSVIITGMNRQNEHTMTVFRRNPQADRTQPFQVIAKIQMGGSITVQERERTMAYRQGIARGEPFAITAYGRDIESENLLDRIEITHEYNLERGIYEQTRISRIPGSQIEQQRLREILSGDAGVFEDFINDLWYHVNPDGTISRTQFLFFDPLMREIIFSSDDSKQVFTWQRSNATRYGIYITSQNVSVRTLRRFLDIGMESLDSIRVRVFEDIRLRISVSMPWDGLYRRAGTFAQASANEGTIQPNTEAIFDSSMGRLQFHSNGEYELSSGASITRGRYAFFRVDGMNLLELRPEQNVIIAARQQNAPVGNPEDRLIYQVTSAGTTARQDILESDNLILERVRLGTTGIHSTHENHIIMTRAR
jgi:hypothetical protein